MKRSFHCLASLFAAILHASATPENPLIPATWFQETTATDGSTQQCIIFTTVPGVEYTFYHSDGLETWTEIGKTYGLGHEFAAAMRETAPAPPPPDPENPPPAPIIPNSASITIQASSGASGGTIVSWPSLDHGNAIRYLIAGSMAPDWNAVPIYVASSGSHQFFITHPAGATAPPEDNPFLETKDAAMISDFEAGFSDFNTAVATAAATIRNTPSPPPPAPDAKGFWRIKADWSLDSDNDGILDHSEFAFAAANAAGPDGLAGNPFSGDTNNDGIPDGQQIDSDGDGIPNAFDIEPEDGLVAYAKISLPRYAMFTFGDGFDLPYEYQGVGHAFAINDRGTVLFPDRVWKAGEFHNLVTETSGVPFQGEEPARLLARAINDQDQIIGSGSVDYTADGPFETICHWASPSAIPVQVLTVAGDVTTYAEIPDQRYSNHLGNDGGFYAKSLSIDYSSTEPVKTDLGWRKWTLPAGGNPLSSASAADFSKGTAPGGIVWGTEYDDFSGEWLSSEITSPDPDDIPVDDPLNVLSQGGNGNLVATTDNLLASTKVRKDGEWKVSPLLEEALDISDDGTAIRNVPNDGEPLSDAILLNGKWTSLSRSVPGIPARWKTSPAAWLSDTSPGGWILAHDRPGSANPPDDISAALLPLRVKGRYTNSDNAIVEEAAGVDDFSIGSSDPDKANLRSGSPSTEKPVQDRIWVMAPSDAEATIVLNAPVHSTAPVKMSVPLLPGERGVTLNGGDELEITASETVITVKNESGHDAGELFAEFKMGDVKSVSQPIGFKLMKKRTIRVAYHKISSVVPGKADNPPDLAPTPEALKIYLDELYGKQINAYFEIVPYTEEVAFDLHSPDTLPALRIQDAPTPGNGALDKLTFADLEMAPIIATRKEGVDINLFVMGGASPIRIYKRNGTDPNYDYSVASVLKGEADIFPGQNTCIVDGDRTYSGLTPGEKTPESVLYTIGHEIGHLMVGGGHPGEEAVGGGQGVAPLPETRHKMRLMCPGEISTTKSRLLVKGEWDEAEQWLTNYPDDRVEREENQ